MAQIFFILSLVVISVIVILPQTQAHNNENNTQCQELNGKNTKCQASNPFIEKACANALYKDVCIQNIFSLKLNETSDIKSIALASLKITKDYGSNVSSWLDEKLKDSKLSLDAEEALSECSENYKDALDDLMRTIGSFKSTKTYDDRFFNDLNTFVSGAMSAAIHCEDSMKKFRAKDVMENKNKVFKQHCSNALAVTIFWSKHIELRQVL